MGAAYVDGFRSALRRWPVVLLAFLASLSTGAVFMAASWSWLSLALDNSLATRTLLTDLDMNVFVDLFLHHGDSWRMLLGAGAMLAAVVAAVTVWLNAITVIACGEDASLGACVRRGVDVYAPFLRLALVALCVDLATLATVYAAAHWLVRWTAESSAEMTFYWISGGAGALGAVVLLFLTTVHDHARIRCVATGSGATRSYLWALAYVARRERRALPLALCLFTSGSAVWIVYQTVGMLMPAHSATGVVVSLLWGQAFMLWRALQRVWSFAAGTELQGLSERPDE